MPLSDIQITNNNFVEYGGSLFAANVIGWDLTEQGIEFRTNVNAPQTLTKLSTNGKPRPYRVNDDKDNNGAKFEDRILTAFQSKWDFPFDFEDFRNTYLANSAFKGMDLYEAALKHITDKYYDHLVTSTIYFGVRDAVGDSPEDICNGFGTIIAAEIIASNLTPVTTGAITSSNAEDKVKLVVRSLPKALRRRKGVVYVSWDTFDKYADAYAENHGFQYQPSNTGDYRIDNTNYVLRPVEWMGNSSRIIATLPNNLVFGTNQKAAEVYPTMDYNVIKTRLLLPVGCQINDLESMAVNEQA